ncbi:MAG TPA: hypothetical protein VMW57_09100 [Methyloceanibacter sp.]|nr:hypothetical protein [Methyloceanibacter sp.]
MIRTSLLAGVILAVATMSAQAAEPVKGAVKGTAEVGKGVVQGVGQAGKGVVKGTGTVVKKTGKGLKCIFTLGNRC